MFLAALADVIETSDSLEELGLDEADVTNHRGIRETA